MNMNEDLSDIYETSEKDSRTTVEDLDCVLTDLFDEEKDKIVDGINISTTSERTNENEKASVLYDGTGHGGWWEDHTSVTPLEKYINTVEKTLREWHRVKTNIRSNVMSIKKLWYGSELELSILYFPKRITKSTMRAQCCSSPGKCDCFFSTSDLKCKDILFRSNKGISSPHDFINDKYDFIMITPYSGGDKRRKSSKSHHEDIIDISQMKLLLSGCFIALKNIRWRIPVFCICGSDFSAMDGYLYGKHSAHSIQASETDMPYKEIYWKLRHLKKPFIQHCDNIEDKIIEKCIEITMSELDSKGVYRCQKSVDIYLSVVHSFNIRNWLEYNCDNGQNIHRQDTRNIHGSREDVRMSFDNITSMVFLERCNKTEFGIFQSKGFIGGFKEQVLSWEVLLLYKNIQIFSDNKRARLCKRSESKDGLSEDMEFSFFNPVFSDYLVFSAKEREKHPDSFRMASFCKRLQSIYLLFVEEVDKYDNVNRGLVFGYEVVLDRNARFKDFLKNGSNVYLSNDLEETTPEYTLGRFLRFMHDGNTKHTLVHDIEYHKEMLSFLIKRNTEEGNNTPENDNKIADPGNFKGYVLPRDSVLNILIRYIVCISCRLFGINYKTADLVSLLSTIWMAFVDVIEEEYWARNMPFMKCSADYPNRSDAIDYNTPLVYQKLCLLNRCIRMTANPLANSNEAKDGKGWNSAQEMDESPISEKTFQKTTQNGNSSMESSDDSLDNHESDSDAECTFYDIDVKGSQDRSLSCSSGYLENNEDNHARQGHKEQLNMTECLLDYPDEPLYVPYTQDLPLLTQDMLDIRFEFMENMFENSLDDKGLWLELFPTEVTSDFLSNNVIQFQYVQLISDIQAFKAANPRAVYEDFIRWYSPKDWDTETQSLSLRVVPSNVDSKEKRQPNMWYELWKKMPVCPISKQPPIFNYQKEGEKIIYELRTLSISDFLFQLLPAVFMNVSLLIGYHIEMGFGGNTRQEHALGKVANNNTCTAYKYLRKTSDDFRNMLAIFPWKLLMDKDGISLDDLVDHISEIEGYISLVWSIVAKCPNFEFSPVLRGFFKSSDIVMPNHISNHEGRYFKECRDLFNLFLSDGFFPRPYLEKYHFGAIVNSDGLSDGSMPDDDTVCEDLSDRFCVQNVLLYSSYTKSHTSLQINKQ